MYITIIREDSERLNAEQWTFFIRDDYASKITVKPDKYATATRPTRRHKYRWTPLWSRLRYEDSLRSGNKVAFEFPEELHDALRDRVYAAIEFTYKRGIDDK